MAQLSIAWLLSKEGESNHHSRAYKLIRGVLFRCHSSRCRYNVCREPYAADWYVVSLRELRCLLSRRLGAIHITLTEEDKKFLEEPYQPLPIVGHS